MGKKGKPLLWERRRKIDWEKIKKYGKMWKSIINRRGNGGNKFESSACGKNNWSKSNVIKVRKN